MATNGSASSVLSPADEIEQLEAVAVVKLAGLPLLLFDDLHRITSYNVCYTKLLRPSPSLRLKAGKPYNTRMDTTSIPSFSPSDQPQPHFAVQRWLQRFGQCPHFGGVADVLVIAGPPASGKKRNNFV